jgi:glycosyltransferase involved in cell wall biosynthesis
MPNAPTLRLQAVVPVFNDWESFAILLRALDAVAAGLPVSLSVSAVDDGSTLPSTGLPEIAASLAHIRRVEIVRLSTNVGHQRAIACGLCRASEEASADALLVMDSDGEDKPEAIPQMLAAAAARPEFVVVGARRKRSENLTFRTGYIIYKSVFKAVTGKKIGFGNFSLISAGYLGRLVMLPDLWNNLAAAVLRSRLPIQEVHIDRGTRYAGKSKMNFTSLIVHGFSAISVYADTIFVRLLIATLCLTGFTAVVAVFVLLLRLFMPSHATPGWATTVVLGMTIIVLQALFTTLTSLLALLNSRVQRLMLPIQDYHPYIREVEVLLDR